MIKGLSGQDSPFLNLFIRGKNEQEITAQTQERYVALHYVSSNLNLCNFI